MSAHGGRTGQSLSETGLLYRVQASQGCTVRPHVLLFFVAIISAGTKSKFWEERVRFILQPPGHSRHCRKCYNCNILFITEL